MPPLTPQIAEEIRSLLDSHTEAIPAVLEIPSKEQPYDASKDSILRRARVCTPAAVDGDKRRGHVSRHALTPLVSPSPPHFLFFHPRVSFLRRTSSKHAARAFVPFVPSCPALACPPFQSRGSRARPCAAAA